MSYFKMIDTFELIDNCKFITSRGLTMTEDVFSCHFPTFPVLPGVLMLEMAKQSIEQFLNIYEKAEYELESFGKVRFQSFARPGDLLQSNIEKKEKNDCLVFSVEIVTDEKKVSSIKAIKYRKKERGDELDRK